MCPAVILQLVISRVVIGENRNFPEKDYPNYQKIVTINLFQTLLL